MTEPLMMHAPCEAGLEEILAGELERLGAKETKQVTRGISFEGDMELLWRANLECRTANRILMRVGNFKAMDRHELYDGIRNIDWSQWMKVNRTMAVDCRTHRSELDQPQFVNQVVKDAICDGFRDNSGQRPSVDRKHADVRINIRLAQNSCTVSLDSSGARLHRRGYRRQGGVAPLKETLAAGILMLADWDATIPLIDPMCGSGTFLIEAALMARNIAPGIFRLSKRGEGFSFQRWANHDQSSFDKLVVETRRRELLSCPVELVGSDIDDNSVNQAMNNAENAGVIDDVSFDVADVSDVRPVGETNVLVINPPYGERLGRDVDLHALYKQLGSLFKQEFAGHTAWILIPSKDLANEIGLRASRRIALMNGALDCRLMKYEMYAGSKKRKHQSD
jgi:putative N6-adenine-specific DNA methylase